MSLDTVLRKMGFSSTTFSEVILIVKHMDSYYTMPFGVLYRHGLLWGRVFQGSRVYEVLMQRPLHATLCITQNPLLFYRAVFEKERLRYRELVVDGVMLPCIKGCSACVFTEIASIVFRESRAHVWLKPVEVHVVDKHPRTLHRAEYAIIEALVHFTKIPFTDREEACRHYQHILLCRDTVYRSSRSRVYRRIINSILERAERTLKVCRGESLAGFRT